MESDNTGLIVGLTISGFCIILLLILIWYFFLQNYVLVKKTTMKELEERAQGSPSNKVQPEELEMTKSMGGPRLNFD